MNYYLKVFAVLIICFLNLFCLMIGGKDCTVHYVVVKRLAALRISLILLEVQLEAKHKDHAFLSHAF